MAARFARAHQETSARPRGLHPWQFAPVAARFARAHQETSARARRRRVKFFAQLSRKKAGRVWDSVPRSWWRQQAQERLKMSRWDIFRWRTLAGGPPCRQGRQRFSHRAFLSPRPKRVPPFGISDGGETRRSASAVDSRLWQLATARAHREDSTRSRRGMVLNSLRLVFSHLSGGVWRRPAPRPLRKISPPNGGARGLLFFCGLLWGDLRGLAFSNFFLRSP